MLLLCYFLYFKKYYLHWLMDFLLLETTSVKMKNDWCIFPYRIYFSQMTEGFSTLRISISQRTEPILYHYGSIGARAGHQRPQPLATLDIIGFGVPISAGTWQVTMTVSEGGVVTLFQIITVGVKWNDLTISWTLGWTLVHSSSTVNVGLSGVRLRGSDK